MNSYPKVLIVSHNVFSESGNMGRTMADMFSSFPSENLAQIFFHSEVPTLRCCKRYYRVTDKNALKSVLSRKSGFKIYTESDIEEGRKTSRTDHGLAARIYQYARRRTPIVYFLRDLMWKLSYWHTEELDQWIQEFQPDVLFFASGDYVFPYRIVHELSIKHPLPIVMWCCDDYYLSLKKNASFLYRFNKKHLLKWAHRIAEKSNAMITISDKMQKDYAELFGKAVDVMRISSKVKENPVPYEQRSGIVYAGNLGVDRLSILLETGKALKKAKLKDYSLIDVYSGEKDPEKLKLLTEENGICFHGAVAQGKLAEVLSSARYLLHVESFHKDAILRTRYSLSTKIGDSLTSGGVILAYGPSDISSMEYLNEHKAAKMCSCAEELIDAVNMLNQNKDQYHRFVKNAVSLAQQCHNKQLNDEKLFRLMDVRKKHESYTD